MLTTKKRSFAWQVLAVISLVGLTACGPPGPRDLRKGERLIQNGKCADAIPILEEGKELLRGSTPTVQANAWNLLGLAYQGAGQSEAASRAYLEALKLDRNLWAADYNLGCLRIEQTNYLGAIDYLSTYTTSRPKDLNGYLLLGRAYLKLAMERTGLDRERQLDVARRVYDYSDKLHSTAEACNALGIIDLMQRPVRSDRIRASLGSFKLALQLDPQYAPALLNLAIVQQFAKESHDALESYRQYLDLKPTPPQATEVERVAHQLDLDTRITILPPKAQERAPVQTNAPPPQRQAPAAVQNPAPKPATVPAPVVKETPKESPIVVEQPSAPTANPEPTVTPQPAPAPAPVVVQAPVVPANPTPVAAASTNTPTTAPATNSTAADIPAPAIPEEKKPTFVQKLNPLHWFKSKKSEASDTIPPAPSDGGPRYTYPMFVTQIPGDRKLAEKLTSEGRQAEKQSNRTEAIWDYQEAIKADPTYFEAGLALGLADIDARDYTGALQALGQALTVQENSADARYAFAWVLGRQGYYQDAANELNKLLLTHPSEVRAHLLLGNYYADNLSQLKVAREHYLKALDLIDSGSPQAAVIRTWLDQHP